MMHVEFRLCTHGWASISLGSEQILSDSLHPGLVVDDIEFEISLGNNPDISELSSGKRIVFEIHANGMCSRAGERVNSDIISELSLDDVRRLHAFLSYLLEIAPLEEAHF